MDVLEAERAHLLQARTDLKRMREGTAWLLDNQNQWGNDELTTRALAASLARRYDQLLDDGVTPVFFGRLDYDTEVFHVGRRHVTGADGEPVVVDWRAPISEPFYRASANEPMGVHLRRRFGFRDGVLTAFEDDHLDRPAGFSQLLVDDIERPRSGPMRDIVATIQPEQDLLVRAPIEQTIAVQGAPGTGKTAVGLHRAAYLLYAHRQRLAGGVLIVGPNRAFLSYVQEVLPALGEVKVIQSTVEDLCPAVRVTASDPLATAVLKGDARMATVLEKALWRHVVRPDEPLVHSAGARRWRIYPDQVRELERAVRGRNLGWEAGRSALAAALAAVIVRLKEDEGIAQSGSSVERLARSTEIKRYVDAVWTPLRPADLVARLLSDPELLAPAARGVLDDTEQALLLRAPTNRPKWSRADLPLLDEAQYLIERRPGFAHLVLDEAQDLSAMQLRVVGRRCRAGSATVLGDLAQATTPWALADWRQVLEHLGKPDGKVQALTIGYRVPREVLDLANRLLPTIAPQLPLASSLRHVVGALSLTEGGVPAVVSAVQRLVGKGSTAVVVPADTKAVARALAAAGVEAIELGDEGLSAAVTLVEASAVKGLEFDHVVLLAPAELPLRVLYVAMTRAVTSLTVVGALPPELALEAA
ncbi:MAG: family ATPase [Frankiales bacterium]|nr:family ATPase [Frankiales bacterium]